MRDRSVVRISFRRGRELVFRGTGFVVDDRLTVATCRHVLFKEANPGQEHIVVEFGKFQQPYRYRVEMDGAPDDLVLLKPDFGQALREAVPEVLWPVGKDIPTPVDVYVLGCSSPSSPGAQYIHGNISDLDPYYGKFLLSSSVNPGDSGGPVLYQDQVIGVIQANDPDRLGHCSAIPVARLRDLLERACAKRKGCLTHAEVDEIRDALAQGLEMRGDSWRRWRLTSTLPFRTRGRRATP